MRAPGPLEARKSRGLYGESPWVRGRPRALAVTQRRASDAQASYTKASVNYPAMLDFTFTAENQEEHK